MKSKVIAIALSGTLLLMVVINILTPTKDVSYSERRKLAQLPKPTVNDLISGELMKDFEDYTLDQFPLRDQFRSLKAFFDLKVLRKKDNNDIYVTGGHVFKMEYPLNVDSVDKMAKQMNKVYDLYLRDMNVFYSIVPDKNYFIKDKKTHLVMDYQKLEQIMVDGVEQMTYINMMDALVLDDYYRTDTHWKQERLSNVVSIISRYMGFDTDVNHIAYTLATYEPYYGVYYGQAALNIAPDTLTYMSTDTMDQMLVYNYESSQGKDVPMPIYDKDKLGKMDSYDVFLSGATPLLTIENPANEGGKELIIFRDSFASSLAPLLAEAYSKITMIDLRYMSHEALGDYINFEDQDVLFIYSTLIVNKSDVIK